MGTQATGALHSVTLLPVGRGEVPGPEVFWMRDFDRWYELCFQVALVQGPASTVLVNTGPADDLGPMNAGWETFLGPRAAMRRDPGERLLEHLERLGVDPADVTHVVLTPLQLYTVSNVLRFPHAQVCMSERGWDHFHHGRPVLHDARETSLPAQILEPLMTTERERVRLLAPEDEVVPGVRTWWSGGHHRASLVVEVDTVLGVAALSDSFFYVANVTQDHPIGICESTWEALDTYERVRRTAEVVIPLYDPGNMERFPDGVVA